MNNSIILENSLILSDDEIKKGTTKEVEIDISNVSIVENKLTESTFVPTVNDKKKFRKRLYSESIKNIEITLKNLLGEKCMVIGNKDSSFYEFLYKIPIYPKIEDVFSNILIIHNGKSYPFNTKWENILKNGDTVYIYRKIEVLKDKKSNSKNTKRKNTKNIYINNNLLFSSFIVLIFSYIYEILFK